MNNEYTAYKLKLRQNLSLENKILLSKRRIHEWYHYWSGSVYVSFSGGKDSTVLLDLVRQEFPDVPAVFADTGLEYPEIRDFVKTIDNVVWVKPEMPFKQVLEKYGIPVISKKTAKMVYNLQNPTEKNKNTRHLALTGIKSNGEPTNSSSFVLAKKWYSLINAPFKVSDKCCDIMKKHPLYEYEKETGNYSFVGVMSGESQAREFSYNKSGCNAFDANRPQSRPIMFWQEKDVWEYLNTYNVPYSKIYDMGEKRTGCMFCMFGVHLEKGENRFQRMYRTHPKQWKYCMENLGLQEVLDYIGIPSKPSNDEEIIQGELFKEDS